jgi:hypothetical protein
MDSKNLSLIFGNSAIWDFYLNNEHVESIKYDTQNKFVTGDGTAYSITNIRICLTSGVLSFEKKSPGTKPVKASLVFIKDKSILIGFEGVRQVKYIKTSKRSFL